MKLYLIRHGQSEANATNTHSGWSPVDLTEKGRAQAEGARDLLADISFDQIYVSDVKRAQQTAQIVFPGRAFTYSPLIREMNNTAMRGRTAEEMTELFPTLYPACRRAFDYAPLGWDCESGEQLRQRAARFMKLVQSEEDTRVAAVCHGGFIRACAAWALCTPTHNPVMDTTNASVSVLEYRRGCWHLRAWNVTKEGIGS